MSLKHALLLVAVWSSITVVLLHPAPQQHHLCRDAGLLSLNSSIKCRRGFCMAGAGLVQGCVGQDRVGSGLGSTDERRRQLH